METDRKWIIVRIDGKIAAVSTDYKLLAKISAYLSERFNPDSSAGRKSGRKSASGITGPYGEISARTISFEELWKLRQEAEWDDFMLIGTDFQKQVWRKLWELTHPGDADIPAGRETQLICYSDFAELCQNRAGVRAVAHAIGLNPISVIIPCHLVIPKESIDKMNEINRKAETTIFKGDDLCLSSILNDNSIDFGEYALGRKLKRELIKKELA